MLYSRGHQKKSTYRREKVRAAICQLLHRRPQVASPNKPPANQPQQATKSDSWPLTASAVPTESLKSRTHCLQISISYLSNVMQLFHACKEKLTRNTSMYSITHITLTLFIMN